jgi:hypothetical protein
MNNMRDMRDTGNHKSIPSTPSEGCHTKSLFERLVSIIPARYAVACLLLTILLGIPGTLLTRYIDSFDFALTVSIPGIITGSEGYWRAVTFYWIITYLIFFFYLFYFIKYFRLRLVDAEVKLAPLLKEGKEACNRAFHIIPSRTGVLATTALVAASFAPSVYRLLITSLGPISAIHVVISQVILDFAGGTGIWLFFSSIWSLRKLAKEPMKLKSSSEDSLFGLGSIGSISLGLVIIYFGALGLRGLGTFASGVETTPTAINIAFESILMIFGFIVFLITINDFHKKMIAQKELEKNKLLEQRKRINNSSMNGKSVNGRNREHMEKLLVIDIMERRLEKTSTWPFDKGALSHISTILLSVTAIMIARIIAVAMNI